ncbi:MAG: SIMPL domain-containing protein [Gammaproteobacteria bacterium]|nr:SIMPL domain-containing protein [Gammaproteobacteria bacterium]
MLSALVAGNALADPQLRGTPGELRDFLQSSSRYVTLDDEATETAVSDRAIIELSVTTENRSLSAALDANRGIRARVMADLQAAGIPAASIKTAEFSTSPEYGLFRSKPSSFDVVNAVSVTVTDETQFRAAAGLVDRYKEVQLSDTRFEHSGKDKTQERVRKAALDKVMASRRFFEEELGLKLRPVAFGTSGSGGGTNAVEEIVVTARMKEVTLSSVAVELPDGFDEIEYRAKVSVTFEVVPATTK